MKALSPDRAIEAAEYIRSHWRYDPETGAVHGRGDKVIGTLRKDGALHALVYLPSGVTSILLHRAAWLLRNNAWPEFEVDHEDGVRSNNRWRNLRAATHGQNQQNRRLAAADGRLIGASRIGNRWRAQIKYEGKVRHIGSFDTEQEAHEAYCKAKASTHPFQPRQRGTT